MTSQIADNLERSKCQRSTFYTLPIKKIKITLPIKKIKTLYKCEIEKNRNEKEKIIDMSFEEEVFCERREGKTTG